MIKITCLTQDQTILFAAEELNNTLSAMGIDTADLKLGLFPDFSLTPKSESIAFDDEIAISFDGESGYLAGSNPRSVLFAVYRFLQECGARWVRPGKDGAYLPKIETMPDLSIREAAEKRHRGVCIEGACSIENVLDMVDWMPKVGYNAYYIQFRDAHVFFDRWYSHNGSTVKKPEPHTVEKSLEFVDQIREASKKRGLLIHAVGHGWTCEPFGVSDHGWDVHNGEDFPQSYIDVSAMVNGKREVSRNMPLANNLCYSNPYVRTTMAEAVISYLKDYPNTDVIHFWLGDYYNNTCECEECRKLHVSDYYVMILNELDRALKRENLDTKIVFLIYYDTMTPPIQEKIENPDRFILMFAPISRTFSKSFPNGFAVHEIPPYKINSFTNPASVDENLAYLYQWEKHFSGDTFDFDYHLMWDHLLDAGGEGVSKILHDDVRHFDALGLKGFVSCQLQRNFFPTALAMTTLARTLWNTATDFDALRKDLYAATFGDAVPELVTYLSTLSRCFDVGAIRGQRETSKAELTALMEEAIAAMEAFAPIIEAHQNMENATHAYSWKLLSIHREMYETFARSILARVAGDIEKADTLLRASHQIAWEKEDIIAPAVDCMFFQKITGSRPKVPEN